MRFWNKQPEKNLSCEIMQKVFLPGGNRKSQALPLDFSCDCCLLQFPGKELENSKMTSIKY